MEESYYHSSIHPQKAIYGKHLDYDILKNATTNDAAHLLKEHKLIHNPPHNQWSPQCFWLKDNSNLLNIKYLGRFEDIEFHLRNITQLIDANQTKLFSRINTSSQNTIDYKRLIDSETRQILEEYYKEDLETFNYDF